jgi:hypothetical protein
MLRRLLARRWPLLAGSCLLIAPPALAADFYVSPQGSNAASGSLDAPFRTIRQGIAVAMPGDTVYVHGGEYVGWENQINPVRAGRADAFITIRNVPGELPILLPYGDMDQASAAEPFDDPDDTFADSTIAFIRVQGFVAYQWPTSGFSNGFQKESSDVEFRFNVADGNGINGIAFYGGSGARIENNIVAHNGNSAPSWSSGINLFSVTGDASVNIVRGNVSFENIDICGANGCNAGQSTDGNGFILDEGAGGTVRFESNIAFRNGGSCLRLTLTPGGQLVNNTCYNNGLDTGYAFQFGEIFASDAQSRNNVIVRNNLAVGSNGQPALGDLQGTNANVGGNLTTGISASVFRDPDGVYPDFRVAGSPQNIVNAADSSATGATDIGFDPHCVVRSDTPIQGVAFWRYAVNYAYIKSVGGVEGCFRPVARALGGSPDVGAYESVATGGCQFHHECDDNVACTQDRCSEQGQCTNSAIAGCCTSDAECDDGDGCTVDSCVSGSCRSASNGVCSGGQTGGGELPPDVTVDLPNGVTANPNSGAPPSEPTALPATTPTTPVGASMDPTSTMPLPTAGSGGSSGAGGCAVAAGPSHGVASLAALLVGVAALVRRRRARALALSLAAFSTWACGSDDGAGQPPPALAGPPGAGGTSAAAAAPDPNATATGAQPSDLGAAAPPLFKRRARARRRTCRRRRRRARRQQRRPWARALPPGPRRSAARLPRPKAGS